MRRTTIKLLRIRRPPHEGRDQIWASSVQSCVGERIRPEDSIPSMLPRQGGDQPLQCLHKAARWLCQPPKNRVDGAGRQRRTSAFLHPLPWTGAA
jgi:hypothetical protein